jgi:glutamine synthetase
MTPEKVLAMAKENSVKVVDLRFMDFPGMWQHFTVPISELTEESFEDGFGFDGSSIRGWQPINASDMLVIPDAATAKIDPFFKVPTLVLICNIADPITREAYTRDPRNIAKKVEAYLKSTGIGDTAFIGPRRNFSFLTTSATTARPTVPSTPSILWKAPGTRAAVKSRTWATSRATRKATFPCPHRTSSRIFVPRCC